MEFIQTSIQQHAALFTVLLPLLVTLVELGRRTWRSGLLPKPLGEEKSWFKYPQLRALPPDRIGYSDRVSYVMAELASLAYYEFEKSDDLQDSPWTRELAASQGFTEAQARAFLEKVLTAHSAGAGNREVLRQILANNGFKLVATLNEGPLQCFICRNTRTDDGSGNFLVTAFRGSEQKVNDWLTNADAVPTALPNGQLVHTGFYSSFRTIEHKLRTLLQEELDQAGAPVPIYYTGHSLGGAWALLAACLLFPEHPGGCYTYGAPRIANYEFFFPLKIPVYRVVNSADIVPRVPPGVLLTFSLYWLFTFLSYITKLVPFVSELFEKAANFVDKLKHYRHHGDQRYLTDVTDRKFSETRLLHNPPLEDSLLWFWKGIIAGSWKFPVKSHSMDIYIEKLAGIASRKN
jgi:triacylglycerol lipase